MEDYPFDLAQCMDPSTGKSSHNFMDYGCPTLIPPEMISGVDYTRWLSWYLQNYTFPGFARKNLPPLSCVCNLSDLSHIVRVRLPDGLDSHPGNFGHSHNNIWRAHLYEYQRGNDPTYHPHTIMLSNPSTHDQAGSILYGKLIRLMTAMRNRAHQRVMIEEGLE